MQNLAALLGGDLSVETLPLIYHRENAWHLSKTMTSAGYEMIYGIFKLDNGAKALAYWYPANLMTTEFEGTVRPISVSHKDHNKKEQCFQNNRLKILSIFHSFEKYRTLSRQPPLL